MKKLLMIFIIFFSVKNLHYYFEKMTVRYQCSMLNAVFQCPKNIAQLQVRFTAQIYNKEHKLHKKEIKCELANVKMENDFTLIFPKIGTSWSQANSLQLESKDKERILFNLTDSKQMIFDRGPHIIQTENLLYKEEKIQAIRMNEVTQRKFQDIVFYPKNKNQIFGTFENPENNLEPLSCKSKLILDRNSYGQRIGNRRIVLSMEVPEVYIQLVANSNQ